MSATRGLVADVVRSSVVDGPGNRYVVFVQGCTFNCVACHNPHTIPRHSTASSCWRDVDDLVDDIAEVAPFLSGVTVSGGEATTQWQFVRELFRTLAGGPRTAHLGRLVDTNGDVEPFVWHELAPWMDGAMVDLKALDPRVHLLLTHRGNERVLASIEELCWLGQLEEVRLLIVPGVNDAEEQIRATAEWLGRLDPVPAVVVLGFRHEGTRPIARRWLEAEPHHLDTVVATLTDHGIAATRRPC
jgi:pyruvate formate lyase activating enzyme